ncbi:MAG: DUF2059 domain-containing protein [Parachlamydiaceae bacterium]
MYKNIVKSILMIALFTSPLMLMAGEVERRAAANELLDAIQFEKVMSDSIDASIQMLKQMDSSMDNYEVSIREFYSKYMSAESLHNEMVDLYAEFFSAQELKEMTAFYKTKTGQKALKRLPELMQRAMQIGQKRVMQHMDELQRMLSEEEAEEQ